MRIRFALSHPVGAFLAVLLSACAANELSESVSLDPSGNHATATVGTDSTDELEDSGAPLSVTSGLVAAYGFDEGSGTTTADKSGRGNNASLYNTQWSTDAKFGGSLVFNGSSSLVEALDSSSLDLTGAVTLTAWVKPASTTGWRSLVFKQQAGELIYALYASNNISRPTGIVYTGGAERMSPGTASLPLNTWTHVATTYSGSSLRLFINGTQVASYGVTGSLPTSGGSLQVGGNRVWGEYFSGRIDEVRVYNRALSSTEIQTVMTDPISGTLPTTDTTAPTAPANLTLSGTTATSVNANWSTASDNVGVAGYSVYRGTTKIGTTTSLSFAFTGLTCGTSYSLGVEAFDAAGNISARAAAATSTLACAPTGDTQAPSAPASLTASNVTTTSIVGSWPASTDNIGVSGYSVYRGSTKLGTTTALNYTFSGLVCATSYQLGVEAYDAAGNISTRRTTTVSTAACPVTGNVVTFSGTVTSTAFLAAINAAPAGAVTVQPVAGQTTFTVTGSVRLTRANVSINKATFTGQLTFANTSSGSSVNDSKLLAAHIYGADDITWQRNVFDAQCLVAQNFIMDEPAGVVPQRFSILNNTFRNYHLCADETVHSEALYIGYSDTGIIEGNLFEDNGNTAHVFFTYWGAAPDPATTYARNICVRSNTFRRSLNPWFSAQIRPEIQPSSNISVDPNNVTDRNLIGNADGTTPAFIRACTSPVPAPTPTPTPTPTTGSANLWIDANGGSCVRSATAGAYNDGAACSSIQAAVAACQPGDTIVMRAGTYGSQSISAVKTSPGCTVIGEDTTTLASLSTGGSYVTLQNFVVDVGPNHGTTAWSNSGSNITLRNVRLRGAYLATYIGGSNVLWQKGELGAPGVKLKRQCGDGEPVTIQNASNITFDGVTFYPQDADTTACTGSFNGFHLEMIRIDVNASYIAIKNSTFVDGDGSNTSSVFITNVTGNNSGNPHHVSFLNNYFGTSGNVSIGVHSNVADVSTLTMAYNTFHNTPGSLTGGLWVGNIGPRPSYFPCEGTHIKNVWQDDRTYSCGSDLVVVGTRWGYEALGLGGTGGFQLQAGSPAVDRGEVGGYCASLLGNKDHDGGPRPTGAACDAGADER